MDIYLNGGVVSVAKNFSAGDMPPSGYLDHEEWWWVQKKAGLKQVKCNCGKYCFPQELSGIAKVTTSANKKGEAIEVTKPVCLECYKRVHNE